MMRPVQGIPSISTTPSSPQRKRNNRRQPRPHRQPQQQPGSSEGQPPASPPTSRITTTNATSSSSSSLAVTSPTPSTSSRRRIGTRAVSKEGRKQPASGSGGLGLGPAPPSRGAASPSSAPSSPTIKRKPRPRSSATAAAATAKQLTPPPPHIVWEEEKDRVEKQQQSESMHHHDSAQNNTNRRRQEGRQAALKYIIVVDTPAGHTNGQRLRLVRGIESEEAKQEDDLYRTQYRQKQQQQQKQQRKPPPLPSTTQQQQRKSPPPPPPPPPPSTQQNRKQHPPPQQQQQQQQQQNHQQQLNPTSSSPLSPKPSRRESSTGGRGGDAKNFKSPRSKTSPPKNNNASSSSSPSRGGESRRILSYQRRAATTSPAPSSSTRNNNHNSPRVVASSPSHPSPRGSPKTTFFSREALPKITLNKEDAPPIRRQEGGGGGGHNNDDYDNERHYYDNNQTPTLTTTTKRSTKEGAPAPDNEPIDESERTATSDCASMGNSTVQDPLDDEAYLMYDNVLDRCADPSPPRCPHRVNSSSQDVVLAATGEAGKRRPTTQQEQQQQQGNNNNTASSSARDDDDDDELSAAGNGILPGMLPAGAEEAAARSRTNDNDEEEDESRMEGASAASSAVITQGGTPKQYTATVPMTPIHHMLSSIPTMPTSAPATPLTLASMYPSSVEGNHGRASAPLIAVNQMLQKGGQESPTSLRWQESGKGSLGKNSIRSETSFDDTIQGSAYLPPSSLSGLDKKSPHLKPPAYVGGYPQMLSSAPRRDHDDDIDDATSDLDVSLDDGDTFAASVATGNNTFADHTMLAPISNASEADTLLKSGAFMGKLSTLFHGNSATIRHDESTLFGGDSSSLWNDESATLFDGESTIMSLANDAGGLPSRLDGDEGGHDEDSCYEEGQHDEHDAHHRGEHSGYCDEENHSVSFENGEYSEEAAFGADNHGAMPALHSEHGDDDDRDYEDYEETGQRDYYSDGYHEDEGDYPHTEEDLQDLPDDYGADIDGYDEEGSYARNYMEQIHQPQQSESDSDHGDGDVFDHVQGIGNHDDDSDRSTEDESLVEVVDTEEEDSSGEGGHDSYRSTENESLLEVVDEDDDDDDDEVELSRSRAAKVRDLSSSQRQKSKAKPPRRTPLDSSDDEGGIEQFVPDDESASSIEEFFSKKGKVQRILGNVKKKDLNQKQTPPRQAKSRRRIAGNGGGHIGRGDRTGGSSSVGDGDEASNDPMEEFVPRNNSSEHPEEEADINGNLTGIHGDNSYDSQEKKDDEDGYLSIEVRRSRRRQGEIDNQSESAFTETSSLTDIFHSSQGLPASTRRSTAGAREVPSIDKDCEADFAEESLSGSLQDALQTAGISPKIFINAKRGSSAAEHAEQLRKQEKWLEAVNKAVGRAEQSPPPTAVNACGTSKTRRKKPSPSSPRSTTNRTGARRPKGQGQKQPGKQEKSGQSFDSTHGRTPKRNNKRPPAPNGPMAIPDPSISDIPDGKSPMPFGLQHGARVGGENGQRNLSVSESSESTASGKLKSHWNHSNEMPHLRSDQSTDTNPQFMQLDLTSDHGVQYTDNRTLSRKAKEHTSQLGDIEEVDFHDDTTGSPPGSPGVGNQQKNLASRLFRARKGAGAGALVSNAVNAVVSPKKERARKTGNGKEKNGFVDRLWNFGNASFGSVGDMSAEVQGDKY